MQKAHGDLAVRRFQKILVEKLLVLTEGKTSAGEFFYAAGLLAAAGSAGKSPRFFQFGFFSGSIQPENSTMVFRGSVTKPPEESGDCSRYSLGVRWITSWK